MVVLSHVNEYVTVHVCVVLAGDCVELRLN
jgi:hypothetical protein